MREYDSKYGYDGKGGVMEEMIARIQDIKAAPESGKTRLVVKPKDSNRSHAVIDIDMKNGRDLKSKETYIFQVSEKDDSRVPGFQRKKSAEFRAYRCSDDPEKYSPEMATKRLMNRFGSGSTTGNSGRIKF